ncbi:hypothetical protein [Lachnoclostridium phytofermentans]|uniref:Uncharacterized protein n=1 Tax=Lachnoclostridium phytofermentans (strain ATCC 700394 / DSM 18823 / ISDg) TaxID=357809 RepID=A9KQR0_LACP7|nr:hypothetical protein [Lachnoclostridium phytofermentans]ABX41973.1 hypothetical protein Cphy_1599 [Lachnoclostridium phytofermentans ISDg]
MKEIIILIIALLLAGIAYTCLRQRKNSCNQYSRFQKKDGAKVKKDSWFQNIWGEKKEAQEEKQVEKKLIFKERQTKEVENIIKEYSGSNEIRKENPMVMKQKIIEDYMEVYQKCEDYRQEENYNKLLISIVPSIQRSLGLCHYILPKKELCSDVPRLTSEIKESLVSSIKEAGFLLNSSGKFVISSIDSELERTRLMQLNIEDLKERLKKKKSEVATIHRYNEMKKICKESASWISRLQIILEQIVEQEEVLETYRNEFNDICAMLEQIFEQNGFQFLYYEDLVEESKIAKSFRNLEDCSYSYPALCRKIEQIGFQIYLNYCGCYKEF